MKKLIYVSWLVLILGFSQNILSQNNLVRIIKDSGTGYGYLEFISDSEGWLVTEDVIKKTYDSGKTWEIKLTIDGNLYNGYNMPNSIDFIDGNVGYFSISTIIDYNDYSWQYWLFKTTDGGNSWVKRYFTGENIEVQADVGKLHFYNENNGWAYYKNSKIIGTTDGGVSWSILSDAPGGAVYKFQFVSDQIGWMMASQGLFKTEDGGQSWLKVTIDGLSYLSTFSAIGNKIWVGSDGVYFSENLGADWNKISTDVAFGNVSSFMMIDENHGFMKDNGSRGYYTADAGVSWELKSESTGLFSAFDYNNCWFFSNRTLKKATDNFSSISSILPDMQFSDIVFVNDLVIVASATNGAIIRSNDGGKSWTFIDDLYGTYIISDMVFADGGNGIAVGYYESDKGFIALTTDTGESWNIVMGNTGEAFSSQIYSADYSNGRFTAKSIGRILRSDNGGLNWSVDSTDFSGASFSQMDMIGEIGFAIPLYGNQKLVKTTNGGTGWSYTADSNPISVYYVAEDLLWANFGSDQILKSYDQGVNWVNSDLQFQNIFFKNSLLGLAYGNLDRSDNTTEGVYLTQDGGNSWEKIQSRIIPFSKHAIDFISAEKGFFANYRDLYTTLSFANVDSIMVSVDDENAATEIANKFQLSQNYPNPFNPSTTIEYSLNKESWVTLKVYDVLGREVAELVNEFKKNGNYKINFNAEGLSSGIYFYTLKTHNNSISQKMLLLK